jgi:hypothetical protein
MSEKITTCIVCGMTIHYATKKPKWCTKCKKKQPKVYRPKKKKVPNQSKQEVQMKKIFNSILPSATYIDNGYYSFLMSPKGSPLQLDRYYPELQLAIEVDGRQHKEYVSYIHKSKAQFHYLQQCDRMKDEYCQSLGIYLIRIQHNEKLTKAYIIRRLEKEGILHKLRTKTNVDETT